MVRKESFTGLPSILRLATGSACSKEISGAGSMWAPSGLAIPLQVPCNAARFGVGASEAVKAEKASSEAVEAGNESAGFYRQVGLISRQSFLSDSSKASMRSW